jgi:hypothetical protein
MTSLLLYSILLIIVPCLSIPFPFFSLLFPIFMSSSSVCSSFSVFCSPSELSSVRSQLSITYSLLDHSSLYSLSDPAFISFCTDLTLSRYLRAHSFDYSKASKGVLETFAWRLKERVDEMKESDFSSELINLMHLTDGRDKAGRPIIINRKNPKAVNDDELRQSIRLIIYTLECACSLIDKEIHLFQSEEKPSKCSPDAKCVWLLDLSVYSRSNRTPFSATREVLSILSAHYPERLHRAFIIDGPALFGYLFSLVRPFIDQRTKEKIQFLQQRKSQKFNEEISKTIEISELPEDFGGEWKFEEEEYRNKWLGQKHKNTKEQEIKEESPSELP